jgi:hypothetical protein
MLTSRDQTVFCQRSNRAANCSLPHKALKSEQSPEAREGVAFCRADFQSTLTSGAPGQTLPVSDPLAEEPPAAP